MHCNRLFTLSLTMLLSCIPVMASEPQREKLASKEIILESTIDNTRLSIDQSWFPFGIAFEKMAESNTGIYKLPYKKPSLELLAKALQFAAFTKKGVNREGADFFFTNVYPEAMHSFCPDLKTIDAELISGTYDALRYFELHAIGRAFVRHIVDPMRKDNKEALFTEIPRAGVNCKELLSNGMSLDIHKLTADDFKHLLANLNLDSLKGIKTILRHINPLTIHELNLRKNTFSELDKDTCNFINECKNLIKLNLSNNQLEVLPPDFLKNHTQLEKLFLGNNKLDILPANLAASSKLEVFSAANNKLKELPVGLLTPHQKTLTHLDLQSNELTSLPEPFLPDAHQLIKLQLNDNNLEKLPKEFLPSSPTVKLNSLNEEENILKIVKIHNNPRITLDDILKQSSYVTQIILAEAQIATSKSQKQ